MPIKFDTATIQLLLVTIWRRRHLIFAPFLVLPALSIIVWLTAPRIYESRMSILVQEISNNPVVQDIAVKTNLVDRIDGLSILLQSRHILLDVITSLKLLPQDAPEKDKEYLVQTLAKSLTAKLTGRDLVELRMRSSSDDNMREILQAAAVRFIDAVRAPGQSSVQNSQVFLKDKIKEQRALLEQAEGALASFRNAHSDQLPELHTSNVQRLTQLRETVQNKKTELAGAEAASQSLRTRLAQSNPIIGQLEQQIVQASGELALARARYTDEHSAVQSQLRRLERLQEQRTQLIESSQNMASEDLDKLWNRAASLAGNPTAAATQDGTLAAGAANGGPGAGAAGNLANSASSTMQPLLISQMAQLQQAESKISSLKREIESLARDLDELDKKTAAFGEVERDLNTLEREVRSQREQYDMLSKRLQTATLTVDIGTFDLPEQIKVIDLPGQPVAVNISLGIFLLASLVGSLLLGGGMAFVAELLDSSIRSVNQLERLVKAPVLSTVPILPALPPGADQILRLRSGAPA